VSKDDLVRVIVAPGKTIQIPHPTEKLVKNKEGKPFIAPKHSIRPGEFFECTREEATRLRRLGVIHDPSGPSAPKPLFGSSDKQDQVIGASGGAVGGDGE
jgi:hypothetical protein